MKYLTIFFSSAKFALIQEKSEILFGEFMEPFTSMSENVWNFSGFGGGESVEVYDPFPPLKFTDSVIKACPFNFYKQDLKSIFNFPATLKV